MLRLHPRRIRDLLNMLFGKDRFNVHHECHPRESYVREKTSRRYRELPCRQIVTEIAYHDHLHSTTPPPPKPSPLEMKAQIRDCERRGCTRNSCVEPIRVGVIDVPVEIASIDGIVIITGLM